MKKSDLTSKKFFGGGHRCVLGVQNKIWPKFGRKIDFRPILLMHGPKKIFQNRFFSIFPKCFKNMIRYQISVQNGFRTSQGPISDHITSFSPVSIDLQKNRVFCLKTCLLLGQKPYFSWWFPSHCTGRVVLFQPFGDVFGTQRTYLRRNIMILDRCVEMSDQKMMNWKRQKFHILEKIWKI